MRTDVKLGVILSMVVVLAAGGYFLFGGKGEAPVPLADKNAAATPGAAKSPAVAPTTTPAKPRQSVTSRDANANKNLPVNPSTPANRTALKPVGTPNTAPVNPALTPATKPATEPVKTDLAANPAGGTVPSVTPERIADSQPTSPIGGPGATPNSGTSQPPAVDPTPTQPAATNPPTVPSSGAELPAAQPLSGGSSSASPMGPGGPSITSNPPTLNPSSVSNPRTGATETHRVQPGDTLETLAQSYYGNRKYAKFLADANPQIVSAGKPSVGTFVKIPPLPADIDSKVATSNPTPAEKSATGATTNASGKRVYKVKAGDSFYRIAREQLGNASRWKELLALNKTAVKGDPTQLQVGQTLVLPES